MIKMWYNISTKIQKYPYTVSAARGLANLLRRLTMPKIIAYSICLTCGKEFKPYRGSIYCSQWCYPKSKPLKETIYTCPGCKIEYQPKRKAQKYCSPKCAAIYKIQPKGLISSTSFKPGQIPWNKGKLGKDSHVFGLKRSEEERRMIGERSKGSNCIWWRGGISTETELARKSMQYKDWRKAVFERDNYTCQMCGARSKAGRRLIIHADHIKPFALYPELRYEVSNGRTLCIDCHKKTPTYGRSALNQDKAHTGRGAQLLSSIELAQV